MDKTNGRFLDSRIWASGTTPGATVVVYARNDRLEKRPQTHGAVGRPSGMSNQAPAG